MRAMILAAGRGRRLGVDHPKCLLELGGRTLIERHLDALGDIPVTLVVGFQQEKLRARLDGRVTYVENPRFADGSIRSLDAGLSAVHGDLLIMDADVLYHREVLTRLIRSPHRLVFAVDPRSRASGEEMMVTVREDRVREITRRPALDCDWMGETVGFTKVGAELVPALRAIVAAALDEGANGDYEVALDRMVKDYRAAAVPVGDLPWTEIDFPEDVDRARELLSRLPTCGERTPEA